MSNTLDAERVGGYTYVYIYIYSCIYICILLRIKYLFYVASHFLFISVYIYIYIYMDIHVCISEVGCRRNTIKLQALFFIEDCCRASC